MMKIILLLVTALSTALNAAYVGDAACGGCHTEQHAAWQHSDHALAMQHADAKSVLGDFNTTFVYHGITTTFFKKGKTFMVRTDGPDGRLHDYEVTYTFGVRPLQQYLIPFPNGKFQTLDIAWDSRPKAQGGHRWFHLHPDDNVTAANPLHWSGPNLNWNYMCADCHSTDLKKEYDPQTRTYHTTYEAINVSCEACHGQGSEHLAWAKNPKGYKGTLKQGLTVDLSAFGQKRWEIDAESGKPRRLQPIERSEIGVCARCHARRSQLDDDLQPGDPFENHYLPALLTDPLYFPDGQIEDEVYVYGSFLQSRMYAEGVTCSDCHDAHSARRRAEGDQVCNRCHRRVDYNTPKHHFHPEGSAGCIDCHMPPRTYMGVDVRHDHSFRIPRPDLSAGTKTPNACNLCHRDKMAEWAAERIKQWFGKTPVGKQDFAHGLTVLRHGSGAAPRSLYDMLMSDAPEIAKATAAAHLGDYPTRQAYMTTLQLLRSDDGMIRLSALRSFEAFPPNLRLEQTFALLDDPLKIVRVEAARQLSVFPAGDLDAASRAKIERGIREYEATLLFNADRAESQTALAALYARLGDAAKAEAAYKEALRLQPWFVNAYINFAHFYQNTGDEKAAYAVLQQGLAFVSNQADILHALGLWYVRNKTPGKALDALDEAAVLAPDNARYQYVYAVALAQSDLPRAVRVLEASLQKHGGHLPTLYALASYCESMGETTKAERYRRDAEALWNFVPKMESDH